MPSPARRYCCSFCGRDRAEVELLFHGHRGGIGSEICSDCAEWFTDITAAYRASPDKAAALIEAHNAAADLLRKAG